MAKVVSYSQENPNKDTTPPVFISMHSVVAGACATMVYRRSVSYIHATPYHSLPYRIEIINIFCKKIQKVGSRKNGSKCYACTDQDRSLPF